MTSSAQDIWHYLDASDDEVAVLSAVYETSGELPTLAAASLLVGPPAISASWPSWRQQESVRPPPSGDLLDTPGEFSLTLKDAVVGRTTMSVQDALKWLRTALKDGYCRAAGDLPEATSHLQTARSPIRVGTYSDSEAASLAVNLARPVVGFHFKRTNDACFPEPEEPWNIYGTQVFAPAIEALGIAWFKERTGANPTGLFVGRFERRAWIRGHRLDTESDLFHIDIGLETDKIDLVDLELGVEERIDNELVFAETLRLEDTRLDDVEKALYGPPPESGRLDVSVALPTLGRGMSRSLRLSHRDGYLLDERTDFRLVESMSISIGIDGQDSRSLHVGETRGKQDLVSLLGGVERVRRQFADLRREGAHNRIFENPADGKSALRSLLTRAPGELLVLDPFFKDWSLVAGIDDSRIRVLIGDRAESPPSTFGGRVKRWRKKTAPFHDRFFLWEGGGVSVGTSAGSKRNRLFRIVRIGSAEAAVLSEKFSLWWDDQGFETIQ